MASSKKVIPYYINLLWKNTHESQALQKEYDEFEMHLPYTLPTGHKRLANNLFLPQVKSSGFTYYFEGWLDRFGYFETHGINLNYESIKSLPEDDLIGHFSLRHKLFKTAFSEKLSLDSSKNFQPTPAKRPFITSIENLSLIIAFMQEQIESLCIILKYGEIDLSKSSILLRDMKGYFDFADDFLKSLNHPFF